MMIRYVIWSIIGLSLLCFQHGTAGENLEEADIILQKIDASSKERNIYQSLKQIITDPAGRKKTVHVELYCIDRGAKRIFHYLSPAWAKGVIINIEKRGEEISVTSPFRKDVQNIVGENRTSSVMESDFTYEDLACYSYVDLFTGTTLRTEEESGIPCHVLSLRPRYENSGYTRLVMWVDSKEYTVNRIDYYQKNESTPFKRMLCKEFRTVSNMRVCTEVHMYQLFNGRSTIQMVTEMRFDEDVDYSRISGSFPDQ